MDRRNQHGYENIQALLHWIKRASKTEVLDPDTKPPTTRQFMPINEIRRYLEADCHKKLRGIIRDLFPDSDDILPTDIVPEYLAVFSTLLQIGKGWHISHFKHHDSLRDVHLPFNPDHLPSNWPAFDVNRSFLGRFCEHQWEFCTLKLGRTISDKCFSQDMRLPIIFMETLAHGASAKLSLIKIDPGHNDLLSDGKKVKLGVTSDVFVLKTYTTNDAEQYYKKEITGFRRLKQNPNIIGFYGSFKRGNTYNLLLEYANMGTLEEFFKNGRVPRNGEDILKFWERFFGLINAVRGIHEGDPPHADETCIFQGWHQDIKPSNILVTSDGSGDSWDVQFKLADLGISHFKRKVSQREDSTASDKYGTRTYGAPECYRPAGTNEHRLKVEQKVDIWSLGCVLSEVARWISGGYQSVLDYRRERVTETSNIDGFRDADCFHDSENVLQSVVASNRKAGDELSRNDYITQAVIDQMVSGMLEDSDGRPNAQYILRTSTRLLKTARENLRGLRVSSDGQGSRYLTRQSEQSVPPLPPILPPGFPIRSARNHDAVTSKHRSRAVIPQDEDISTRDRKSTVLNVTRTRSPDRLTMVDNDSDERVLEVQHSSLAVSPTGSHPAHSGQKYCSGSLSIENQKRRRYNSTEAESPESHSNHNGNVSPTTRGMHQATSSEDSTTTNRPRSGVNKRNSTGNQTPNHHNVFRMNSQSSRAGYQMPRSSSPESAGPSSPSSFQQSYIRESNVLRQAFTHQENPYMEEEEEEEEIENSLGPPNQPELHSEHPGLQNAQISIRSSHQRPQSITIQRPSFPFLSVQEALDWKQERKKSKTQKRIENWHLQDRLASRDHIFLIDDSTSMSHYWNKNRDRCPGVVRVFEALSYLVKEKDPNGIDLWFTISPDYEENCSTTTKLIDLVKSRRHQGNTDINVRLTKILEDYQAKFDKKKRFSKEPKPVRPLNLYILTDGVWEENCNPEAAIRSLVQKLVDMKKTKLQVGIQFISFGNDERGLARLNYLDDGLELDLDIVDHVPSTGNVWKMLLGSINQHLDKVKSQEEQSHTNSWVSKGKSPECHEKYRYE